MGPNALWPTQPKFWEGYGLPGPRCSALHVILDFQLEQVMCDILQLFADENYVEISSSTFDDSNYRVSSSAGQSETGLLSVTKYNFFGDFRGNILIGDSNVQHNDQVHVRIRV